MGGEKGRPTTQWPVGAQSRRHQVKLGAAGNHLAWLPQQSSVADMNDDGRPDLIMGEHRGACAFLSGAIWAGGSSSSWSAKVWRTISRPRGRPRRRRRSRVRFNWVGCSPADTPE
ncbi:hypothetical protein [Mesorhizobium onobrychidis]|uniref:hypothetical protein n=1 Tax=Mesorhizobium onobrychidis TaxID=2775404 RepID=UPI0035A88E18